MTAAPVPGSPPRVRPATAADLADAAAIYNAGIRGRGATFETVERTPADLASWLAGPHPFLAAVDDGGDHARADAPVLGWARASAYRPRACYAGIAEFSVYVAAHARGRRVGDALMAAFVPACSAAGFWKLVSRVFPENAASCALCARHGFREVGTYERHAQLDGVWRDVIIVERLLPEHLT